MKKTIETNGKVYDAATARRVAEQLQEGESDGWKYIAEIKDGFGMVAVYDENGQKVGYF